jgi:hypothetical protein
LDVAFEEFMKLRYEFYRAFTTYSERLPIKPITCACLAAVPERYAIGVLQKIIAWAYKIARRRIRNHTLRATNANKMTERPPLQNDGHSTHSELILEASGYNQIVCEQFRSDYKTTSQGSILISECVFSPRVGVQNEDLERSKVLPFFGSEAQEMNCKSWR